MAIVLLLCCYLPADLTEPTEQKKPGHFRDRAFPYPKFENSGAVVHVEFDR